MLIFPGHVFVPDRAERPDSEFFGNLQKVGHEHPIWWMRPVGYRDIRRVSFTSTCVLGESVKQDGQGEEFDTLYNAIIANPFDAAARQHLADYIQERNEEGAEGWPQLLRDYPGGNLPRMPAVPGFHPWDGPGYIGSGAYGTWDVWVGVSGQFGQACKAGLFLEAPITRVICLDRAPLVAPDHAAWFDDHAEGQSLWVYRTTGPFGPGTLEQSLLLPVIPPFFPGVVVKPYPGIIGAYRAFNRNWALFGLSCAYVNLGRYVSGLPALDWLVAMARPDMTEIAAQHEYWRNLLGIRPETSHFTFHPGGLPRDKRPPGDYGRRFLRSLLTRTLSRETLSAPKTVCRSCGTPVEDMPNSGYVFVWCPSCNAALVREETEERAIEEAGTE